MTTFAELRAALEASGIPFTAFAWATEPETPAWGVVAIDGGVTLRGDDTETESGLEGTVDLFTRNLSAADFQTVNGVLRTLDLAWRLNSVQYGEERRLIHYEWVWQSAAPAVFE